MFDWQRLGLLFRAPRVLFPLEHKGKNHCTVLLNHWLRVDCWANTKHTRALLSHKLQL